MGLEEDRVGKIGFKRKYCFVCGKNIWSQFTREKSREIWEREREGGGRVWRRSRQKQ